ncbi:MAG: YHYH protein [Bythopirellula sp.]
MHLRRGRPGAPLPAIFENGSIHELPLGAYHYHGLPTGLLKKLGFSTTKHSPLVGWAADGFPIYCRFGYLDPQDPASRIVELHSSFAVKDGKRPGDDQASENRGPGGKHDGTFIQDYAYDD